MARSNAKSSLLQEIDLVLKPLGFARCKFLWNRSSEIFVEAVDVQQSRDRTSFTVNAGVLDPSVYALIWGKEVDEFIEVPDCSAYARVGRLIGQHDVWWEYSDVYSAQRAIDAIQDSVIPFLSQMSSLIEQINWIDSKNNPMRRFPLSSINRAVIEFKLGNIDRSRALLSEVANSSSGDWKTRAQEVGVRLGFAQL